MEIGSNLGTKAANKIEVNVYYMISNQPFSQFQDVSFW